jgi:hypothetical protein
MLAKLTVLPKAICRSMIVSRSNPSSTDPTYQMHCAISAFLQCNGEAQRQPMCAIMCGPLRFSYSAGREA